MQTDRRLNLVRDLLNYGTDGSTMVGLPFVPPDLSVWDYVTGQTDKESSCMKGKTLRPLARVALD